MLVVRCLLIMLATLSLTACAFHNKQPKDAALSSSYEVSQTLPAATPTIGATIIAANFMLYNIAEPQVAETEITKGIYLSQATMENRDYLQHLIAESKAVGINSFIIDLNTVTNAFEKNILLIKNSGIRYVARIKVFPKNASAALINSEGYWLSRYRVVDQAIKLGADEIQLDNVLNAINDISSAQYTADINRVIAWFKEKIGDKTKIQFEADRSINLSNADPAISDYELNDYILSQIAAVEENKNAGWYAWSANNEYDRLFKMLKSR